MSDHFIVLVPEDPHFIPSAKLQKAARKRLAEMAPDADQVEVVVSETIQFFDCGANFEKVLCPSCGQELSADWWAERMGEDEDEENGFKLDRYQTPCCNATSTLRELVYDWPQTFGRFALEAMNANIGTLTDKQRRELERILGTKLVVIYQHT